MLKKSLQKKNIKKITLRQIDAHYGKVIGSEEQILAVWECLSYEKMIKLKWKPRPEKMMFSFLNRKGNKFPWGLCDYICDNLNEQGYEIEIEEINFKLKPVLIPKLNGITFENYQSKILKLAGRNKRGIFVAQTGAGKSVIAAGIIAKYDIPVSLFVTINKSIFNQTVKDFEKWFGHICDIGKVGDGNCEVGHITIALYQSLSRFDLKKFDKILSLVIIDEAHAAGNSLSKILSQFKNVYYRYGLTATEHQLNNDKQKHFEMVGNTGPILEKLEDGIVKSRVVDCDVYMVNYVCKNPQGHNYHSVFREDLCCSETRNTKLLKAAKRLALDKNKSVLFICDEVSQTKVVEQIAKKMGIKCKVAHGKNKSGLNEEIKEMLQDKKIKLVISTSVFKTGMNLPSLDCLVLGSARKSQISLLQSIGRARRVFEGKESAIIIDSYDMVLGDKKKKYLDYFEEYSIGRLELYKEKGWFKRKLLI